MNKKTSLTIGIIAVIVLIAAIFIIGGISSDNNEDIINETLNINSPQTVYPNIMQLETIFMDDNPSLDRDSLHYSLSTNHQIGYTIAISQIKELNGTKHLFFYLFKEEDFDKLKKYNNNSSTNWKGIIEASYANYEGDLNIWHVEKVYDMNNNPL